MRAARSGPAWPKVASRTGAAARENPAVSETSAGSISATLRILAAASRRPLGQAARVLGRGQGGRTPVRAFHPYTVCRETPIRRAIASMDRFGS